MCVMMMQSTDLFADDDGLEDCDENYSDGAGSPRRFSPVNVLLTAWVSFFCLMSLMAPLAALAWAVACSEVGDTFGTITNLAVVFVIGLVFHTTASFTAAFAITCFHTSNRIRRTAQTLKEGPFDYEKCMDTICRIDRAADALNDRFVLWNGTSCLPSVSRHHKLACVLLACCAGGRWCKCRFSWWECCACISSASVCGSLKTQDLFKS